MISDCQIHLVAGKMKNLILLLMIFQISPQINKISKWFEFAPNNSGNDGTKFTLNILKDFKNKHLIMLA